MRNTIGLCAVLVQGCAVVPSAVVPDAVRLETVHESHIVQHAIVDGRGTHYGRDGLGLVLKWNHGPVIAEISEGYSFHGNDGSPAPREIFQARMGYEWRLK